MNMISKAALILCALAVAGCSNPNRFGADDAAVDLNSAPPVQTAVDRSSPSYFSQTIGDRVLFAVDESTLSAEARSILTAQASWLMDNGGYSMLIEGHADEQGTREYNLALGARRASAVQQFLISQGVAPSRLRTVTFGKERPIEICSEEACYQQNRRAVSVLNAGTS